MDQAVGLVQAYLRVNGYFTVSEYPVIVTAEGGGYRTATDLDVLAFRFPGPGALPPQEEPSGSFTGPVSPDPELGVRPDRSDMLIGEVKEGTAELNAAATNPAVLRAALTRFGCCPADHVDAAVQALRQRGRAALPDGHEVRLVAFGSTLDSKRHGPYLRITLGHILKFLERYVDRHWEALRVGESKDPAFGFLVLLGKARRGEK